MKAALILVVTICGVAFVCAKCPTEEDEDMALDKCDKENHETKVCMVKCVMDAYNLLNCEGLPDEHKISAFIRGCEERIKKDDIFKQMTTCWEDYAGNVTSSSCDAFKPIYDCTEASQEEQYIQ